MINFIYTDNTSREFALCTPNMTYAFRVDKEDRVIHVHWGGRVERCEELFLNSPIYPSSFYERDSKIMLNEEYTGWGGYYYDEAALKVLFTDGTRDLSLRYKNFRVQKKGSKQELLLILKDLHKDLFIELSYIIYDGIDLLDRKATIINNCNTPITLESAYSANLQPPRGHDYRVTHLSGMWKGEFQREQTKLTQSSFVLESRRGITSHDASPWVALDYGEATEESGELWFGALHWSGNWKIRVDKNHLNQVKLTGGVNDFDLSWLLEVEERFETPTLSCGYTKAGFGAMSRSFHSYQLQYHKPHTIEAQGYPIEYNTWEYEFDINEEKVLKLIDLAADVGYERFVVDDGWFGERESADAGLGDWYPNPKRFPNGLKSVVARAKERGLSLGIWVEPEMVNPDSNLFRKHPEWIINFKGITPSTGRGQYILNIADNKVKEFVLNTVNNLLQQYPYISYVKWDMNRYFSEPGWPEVGINQQKKIWIKYVQNLYEIWGKMREKNPKVVFINCASGGGRVDLGLGKYTDCEELTDCYDPIDRIRIFEGYTYVFPPQRLGGTAAGLLAGMVPLGYDKTVRDSLKRSFTLLEMDKENIRLRQENIALMKRLRHLIAQGEFYRLRSSFEGNFPAYMYVSADKNEAVLGVSSYFTQYEAQPPAIKLKGLNPEYMYEVEQFGEMSGQFLMEVGLHILFTRRYDSKIIIIKRVTHP